MEQEEATAMVCKCDNEKGITKKKIITWTTEIFLGCFSYVALKSCKQKAADNGKWALGNGTVPKNYAT